ncbi:MAG: HEAT repeat domain-containing protein [Anaerolineae bacterium]|nr:HEAT repeat domain-containing protein [Anaerolineae bacterium]
MIDGTLIAGLNHASASVRLDVVRVLGMVEETRALDPLRARYPTEPDETVRRAIAWAGSRLFQAQQKGHTTVDAVCRNFGVDRALENTPDAVEAELLRKLQDQFDRDLLNMKERQNVRRAGTALAAGLGGAMLGGASLGAMAMAGTLLSGTSSLSSGLEGRPVSGATRTPATRPSEVPIEVWVRRLRESTSPEQRAQAALELAQLNNPRALPHLAAAFLGDTSAHTRETAERCGKALYWSITYWEMEQSGALAQEMEQRAQRLGKTLPRDAVPAAQAGPPVDPSPLDVGEILRKAQQERDERRRKRQ